MDKIKPGDKIYIPIFDDVYPDESFVGADKVFDVGEKGIYLNYDGSCAEFLSFDEVEKFSLHPRKKRKKNYCV